MQVKQLIASGCETMFYSGWSNDFFLTVVGKTNQIKQTRFFKATHSS
jgi:hypothetical protein